MGRTLTEIINSLPADEQARIETRYRELKAEVESLQALRRVTGKAQADIARALKIKQPSVSKIEKQADMYISTLRNYVEAAGGQLDLVVRMPEQEPFVLRSLGDAVPAAGKAPGRKRPAKKAPAKKTASRKPRARGATARR